MRDDIALLRETIRIADAAKAAGNHPFGALLADPDGAILITKGNAHATEGGTGHAELNVARAAAAQYTPDYLAGCTLYTSVEPCSMCSGGTYWAGIGRLVYGASDEKGGAVDHGPRFFDQPTCHWRPDVSGGVLADEASEMLKAFFRARRAKPNP